MQKHKTNHGLIQRDEYSAFCGLVLAAWDGLGWRHHGLGMLQAYLLEGEEKELRVHIWDPELVDERAVFSGSFHDHRFDTTSYVLEGSVPHKPVTLNPLGDVGDPMEIYTVKNARAAREERDTGLFEYVGPATYSMDWMKFHAGSWYSFPKQTFHQSAPIVDRAVTLILKTKQVKEYARILVPPGTTPTHMTRGFELSPDRFNEIVAGAKARLTEQWLASYD